LESESRERKYYNAKREGETRQERVVWKYYGMHYRHHIVFYFAQLRWYWYGIGIFSYLDALIPIFSQEVSRAGGLYQHTYLHTHVNKIYSKNETGKSGWQYKIHALDLT